MPSALAGQSIYQDTAPLAAPYHMFTFGAALKAPWSASATETYPVSLIVHQSNAAGTVVVSHFVPVQGGKDYRFFEGDFTRHPNAQRFRFEVLVGVIHTEFEMTDAWIAPRV